MTGIDSAEHFEQTVFDSCVYYVIRCIQCIIGMFF